MQDDRQHLADTVLQAREAKGFTSRKSFAEYAKVSLRSLDSLERGETVGKKVLARVESALEWAPGSSRHVLTGGLPAPNLSLSVPEQGGPDLRDEVEREIWKITDLDEDMRWVYIHRRRSRLREQGEQTGARQLS